MGEERGRDFHTPAFHYSTRLFFYTAEIPLPMNRGNAGRRRRKARGMLQFGNRTLFLPFMAVNSVQSHRSGGAVFVNSTPTIAFAQGCGGSRGGMVHPNHNILNFRLYIPRLTAMPPLPSENGEGIGPHRWAVKRMVCSEIIR